jgi:threonine/homoserine/homoserine lactone efflux protein
MTDNLLDRMMSSLLTEARSSAETARLSPGCHSGVYDVPGESPSPEFLSRWRVDRAAVRSSVGVNSHTNLIAAVVAGLLAGYGIAVPVGPMATYLVSITARTSLRVGVAAGMGIATVDGAYASLAVLGGATLADTIRPARGVLRWLSVAVLMVLAARVAWSGLQPSSAAPAPLSRPTPVLSPARAYVSFVGLTIINPSTVIYFVALVVGLRSSSSVSALDQVLFVAAVFAASASWQLLLAGGGAFLGRVLTGERGRRVTSIVSGFVIALLATRLAVS